MMNSFFASTKPLLLRSGERAVFCNLVLLVLVASISVVAAIIVPTELSSKGTGDGATDQWAINCLFKTCGDPNLIQCYVSVKSPEEVSVSVNLRLVKEGAILSSSSVQGYFKKDRGNAHIFNFAVHPQMLVESELRIYPGKGQYLMKMSEVEIVDGVVPADK